MLKLLERLLGHIAYSFGCVLGYILDIDFVLATFRILMISTVLGFVAYETYEMVWMHHAASRLLQIPLDWIVQRLHS